MVQALWTTVGLLGSPILGWLILRLFAGILNDLADLLMWLFRLDTDN